ncbi:MAG TPA: hypothetical protein VNO86_04440 [Candidatus Binatia bacterium]|nr:hypothetical protein [Candidatus Binatia bacterium]
MTPPQPGLDRWSRDQARAAIEADPALDRSTAERLSRALVRVHPSFRFEERLARELAELAASLPGGTERAPAAVPTRPTPKPALPREPEPTAGPAARSVLPPSVAEAPRAPGSSAAHNRASPGDDDRHRRARPSVPAPLRHPLVIGGAITSAAISIAGVAFLAWRRSHPSRHPMARAVRLAHGGLAHGLAHGLTHSGPARGVAHALASGGLSHDGLAAAGLGLAPSRSRRRGRSLAPRGPALLANLAIRAAERTGHPGPAGTTESTNARPG